MNDQIEMIVTCVDNLHHLIYNASNDMAICLTQRSFLQGEVHISYPCPANGDLIADQLIRFGVSDMIFLSKADQYQPERLFPELQDLLRQGTHRYITLLIPYKTPPECGHRDDGKLRSFILSASLFDAAIFLKAKARFHSFIYHTVYQYLNSAGSINLEAVQVHKPPTKVSGKYNKLLKDALLVLPHKGSVKFLNRSLKHIRQTLQAPAVINVCFDDHSYKKADQLHLNGCDRYLNAPLNVGPYLPRHYSIVQTEKKFIFFHDSDDISIEGRFEKQINELMSRQLDMIGSHELRIDQFSKSLILIRFPLDVNRSLALNYCHPLFHPTSLITKQAYLRTKGFSTDRRFAYDTQFLIRSHFFLKIGNIDDFLYLRFRRPSSITTSAATKLGNDARRFLLWRWSLDFRLILNNKLRLDDSSLVVQPHQFSYELIKID